MTDFDSVKDSGARRSFDTGSVRDVRTGKGRYDLIPPVAIRRIAQHFENGAVKYGDKNWELGQPLSGYLDSGLRHTFNLLELKVDEDHAAAGIWNLIAFLCTAEWIIEGRLPRDLDDIGFCDALEESREDKALEDPQGYEYDSDRWEADYAGGFTEHHDDSLGIDSGRPAKQWTPDDVVEAETVVDVPGDPSERTTVLTDEGHPDTDWSGWVDLGHTTDDPWPWIPADKRGPVVQPSWVPRTVSFEVGPIEQETIDLLWGKTPARFEAGPPAETTDTLAPFIAEINRISRELAEQCWPIRYVAGIGTEETMQALKDKATEASPAAAQHLQGDVTLFGLPVYEVDADDPALGGQPWAIVPQSWAQRAVQRSLDRD
jgi:hypothetical protein